MSAERTQPDSKALSAELRAALEAHAAGKQDSEGTTTLDVALSSLCAPAIDRALLNEAIVDLATTLGNEDERIWVALELFLALSDLRPPGLANVLEESIAVQKCPSAKSRASVYAMLAEFGKPPTAKSLLADTALKRELPLCWLDLVLPAISSSDERQRIFIDAVRDGHVTAEDLSCRREEIRELGGRRLGNWLRSIREALPRSDQAEFDQIIRESFEDIFLPQSIREIPAVKRNLAILGTKRDQSNLVPA